MRVIVTGGAGFVGRYVVSKLNNDGHTVEVLDKETDGLMNARRVDATELAQVAETLGSFKPEVVVHLAGLVGSTGKGGGAESLKSPYQYFSVNFNSALSVYEACRRSGVYHVLCMSSFSPYGRAKSPINEDTPLSPNNPYGGSKSCVEDVAKVYSINYGIRTVIFRPPLICGEGQKEMNALREFVTCALTGAPIEIMGDGRHVREFVHPSDVASALSAAVTYVLGMPEPYQIFVLGGRPISMIDLAEMVVKKVGRGSVVFKPANSQTFDQFTDHTKAQRLLKWEPKISVEEIVARVVEDIRSRLRTQNFERTRKDVVKARWESKAQ